MNQRLRKTTLRLATLLAIVCCSLLTWAASAPAKEPSLDEGFRLLYALDFDGAHRTFTAWEQVHPDNPLGPAADAAGLLFSEFHRLGILESQFYEDDKKFDERKKQKADPAVRDRFNAALRLADERAKARLAKDPKDRDALFGLTLAAGLQADYAALIEKSNMSSLRFTRESNRWAEQLLEVDPECYDAHIATGTSKYIIGSMSAPVRWLLRLGGGGSNKKVRIQELQLTANKGRYLAPFARILLAIAYVREKDKARAIELLASLRDEFPTNPLFQNELARLNTGP